MNWPRLGIATAAVAYMQWGPVQGQLLGGTTPAGAMSWKMYRTAATDLCEVRFRVDGAAPRAIDRFELLGHDYWHRAPGSVKRPHDDPSIRRLARKLCRELPPDETLFVTSRCATQHGWEPLHEDTRMCRGADDGEREE